MHTNFHHACLAGALLLGGVAGAADLPAAAPAAAPASQVRDATHPLPQALRAGAAVVSLDAAGLPQLVRAGSNELVCIADQPGDADFDVRCYHKDFIAVVYRAFQLRREAGAHGKPNEVIEAEIKAGKISLPPQPTAGYRCLGPISGLDPATGATRPPIDCWESVHFPYRTATQIGLLDESQISQDQRRLRPYVMSSGRYWAHVMIEHPEQSNP